MRAQNAGFGVPVGDLLLDVIFPILKLSAEAKHYPFGCLPFLVSVFTVDVHGSYGKAVKSLDCC